MKMTPYDLSCSLAHNCSGSDDVLSSLIEFRRYSDHA